MPIPAPILSGTRREFQIAMLFDGGHHRPGDATRALLSLILPPWQRGEVWSVQQKARFIEGIYLGMGCGYYVVNGKDWDIDGAPKPGSGWLLDGQQRIAAIRDFAEDRVIVFGDTRFSELNGVEHRRFMRTSFPAFELEYTGDENALRALYDRLNFGGTPHLENERASLTNSSQMAL